jgi:hypothetical protein
MNNFPPPISENINIPSGTIIAVANRKILGD